MRVSRSIELINSAVRNLHEGFRFSGSECVTARWNLLRAFLETSKSVRSRLRDKREAIMWRVNYYSKYFFTKCLMKLQLAFSHRRNEARRISDVEFRCDPIKVRLCCETERKKEIAFLLNVFYGDRTYWQSVNRIGERLLRNQTS